MGKRAFTGELADLGYANNAAIVRYCHLGLRNLMPLIGREYKRTSLLSQLRVNSDSMSHINPLVSPLSS